MTLKEIAVLTGVSVSTVSRVINGQDPKCASPEVHNKIWAAVRNFGYSPNPFAQSLKRSGNGKPPLLTAVPSRPRLGGTRTGSLSPSWNGRSCETALPPTP